MPNSVVTLRTVKNQSTGLDLSVSSVKEIPGLISYMLEYSIIVVTSLQCFKLPQHKESDTVQFVVVKRYEDFEKFQQDLAAEFPRTVLPQMPKTFLTSLFELNISEKHSYVDDLLKFVAVTPIVATNHVTLEFLGVNPLTAGKFTVNRLTARSASDCHPTPSSTSQHTDLFAETENDDNLFDVEPESSASLQTSSLKTDRGFEPTDFSRKYGKETRLFGEANFDAEAISADAEDLFFVPGAKIDKRIDIDLEDFSDLLTIDDSFNKLLQKTTSNATGQQHNNTIADAETTASSQPSSSSSSQKPMPMTKPKLVTETGERVGALSKPVLPPKPKLKSVAPLQTGASSNVEKRPSGIDAKLNISDVMSYIEQNTSRSEDSEPDLFA